MSLAVIRSAVIALVSTALTVLMTAAATSFQFAFVAAEMMA
jgi:hypothetical protein